MKTINVNSSIEELIWVPTAVQFTFGAFGNVLALVLLILSRRQHKWISFYRLYAGLVITDLSIWLLAEPVALARYASKFKWTIPPGVCQYESYMTMFGLLSSAFIICAMSVDRLKAMYSTHDEHHGKLYMGILVVIWTFSGLYSGIHIWTDQTRDFYPGTWCYFNYINSTDNTIGKMNTYSYLVLGCTSILLIVILNILMLTLACCNTELRSRLTDRHRISGGYDWHSYVFLIIVAVVFTTLWTAHLVIVLTTSLKKDRRQEDKDLDLMGIRLVMTNAIINPWLYVVFRKENLQKALKVKNWIKYKVTRSSGEECKPILEDTL